MVAAHRAVDWRDIDTELCAIHRTLAVIGEKWTILVIRDAANGVRRFDDFRRHVGLSEAVLSDRLKRLVTEGIFETREYQEPGQRRRAEYHLTQKGRDLYPAITALREWGDKYLSDPEGPPVLVTHRGCGAAIHTAIVCDAGHTVDPEDIERTPGPSARPVAA